MPSPRVTRDGRGQGHVGDVGRNAVPGEDRFINYRRNGHAEIRVAANDPGERDLSHSWAMFPDHLRLGGALILTWKGLPLKRPLERGAALHGTLAT